MWRFDSLRKYDRPAGIACFCDTGWGIAFAYDNQIKVCAYWGEETNFEFGLHDESLYPHLYIAPEYVTASSIGSKALCHWVDMPITHEFSIPAGSYIKHLHVSRNRLFVFANTTIAQNLNADDTPFTQMFVLDALSGVVLENVNFGESFTCKPCVLKGKIWLTTDAKNDNVGDTQYLVSRDEFTFTEMSREAIPARKQDRAHRFVLVNNWLITDLYNDNGIAKFDASTGEFISTTFVNRKPLNMFYNNDNNLVVASYKGMISTVNLSTNVVAHVSSSVKDATGGIVDDGTYWWTGTTEGITRTTKDLEEENLITQSEDSSSSAVERTSFASINIRELILSQPFVYQGWINDEFVEHTRRGYLLIRTDTQVFAIRNVPMWREYYNQVLGTAMISTGETAYYGETE